MQSSERGNHELQSNGRLAVSENENLKTLAYWSTCSEYENDICPLQINESPWVRPQWQCQCKQSVQQEWIQHSVQEDIFRVVYSYNEIFDRCRLMRIS